MPEVDHIRVGFFHDDSKFWPIDTKWGKGAQKLAEYLWQASENDRLDLVLGITPNGASYLLLPHAWVRAWNERAGKPAFFVKSRNAKSRYADSHTTEFLSLSPIHFIGGESLCAKLKSYEQRSGKRAVNGGDTSKANHPYFLPRTSNEVDKGHIRGDFENSRLFYLLHSQDQLQLPPLFKRQNSDLTRLSLDAYAVHPQSAMSHARVLALSFSTITAGTEADARVLDIGWCDVFVRSSTTGEATNCQFQGQQKKVPGLRFNHDSVTTEVLPSDVIASRLQQIFGLACPESPVILLVHGAANTRRQLDSLGLHTSHWHDNIRGVLHKGGLRDRERSRSPTRHRSNDLPPRPASAVHIVDVEALANCAMNRGSLKPSTNHARVRHILENAAKFNVDIEGRQIEVPRYDDQAADSQKLTKILYNAGHDSALIAETWLALANGPDIDELIVQLGEDIRRGPTVGDSPPPEPEPQRELNDDDDPNVEPPATGFHAPSQTSGGGIIAPYDADLSDEGDEYY